MYKLRLCYLEFDFFVKVRSHGFRFCFLNSSSKVVIAENHQTICGDLWKESVSDGEIFHVFTVVPFGLFTKLLKTPWETYAFSEDFYNHFSRWRLWGSTGEYVTNDAKSVCETTLPLNQLGLLGFGILLQKKYQTFKHLWGPNLCRV